MSNYRELAKHSGNYLFATLATKALAFISIPVYTYLLTVEEYGVYNVFISTTGITTVLMTLNTEVAVSRYYFDCTSEDDFKRFVGTSTRLSMSIFILMSLLLVLFRRPLASYLGFETLLTVAIIPVSLYSIVNSIFQQIYQPMLKSRKIAVVSSVQSYLAFALSTIFILLLDDKKYYGLVYGTVLAMLILALYSINQIKSYYIGCWDKAHLKYILNYSLPYLPYSLSGIIIAQFGKLIIGQQQGFESAGLYSFASNIATLMLVVISVSHSAWNPYYMRFMNLGDSQSIDRDYNLIWRITLICAAGLSVFGYELGWLLGKEEYCQGLYIIPVLALGYCFYQWSYVFMRNVGYAKKTIWNAVVVIASGIANLMLSYILIGSLGDLGVAIAFTISYFVMLLLGWIINRTILHVYATSMKKFLTPLIMTIPVLIFSFFNPDMNSIYLNETLKVIILLFFCIVMVYPYRHRLIAIIRRK